MHDRMHCKVVVTMSFFTTGSGIVRQVAAPQILPGQNGLTQPSENLNFQAWHNLTVTYRVFLSALIVLIEEYRKHIICGNSTDYAVPHNRIASLHVLWSEPCWPM